MDRQSAARQRAQHGTQARSAVLGLRERMSFPGTLRAQTIERKGKQLVQLDGYASTVGKPYEMWDMFGPYTETVATGAFGETLAANPDTNFVANHIGVSMARTLNGTLELEADGLGLRYRAFVNPQRNDVHDLVTAVEDGDVAESSFRFTIDDGEWNDDFTQFVINKVDIHRGDVSAVNFGANPNTSVAVRAEDLLRELDGLPLGAQRAAFDHLATKLHIIGDVRTEPERAAEVNVVPVVEVPQPTGRSLRLAELMLRAGA